MEASWKSIGISTWKQFASAYEGVLKDTPIDANDTEQVNAIMSSLREIKDIKGALNVLGEVGNWISYCDTAIDVVEKLSKLESILSCSTETAEILQHLRDRAQTGTPLWLVLDDFCTMLSGTLSPEIIRSILTGEAILEEVCKEMASILWSQTVALAESYGLILKAGQSIGKFTSDTLFNTSATIAEYYKLEAMYRLEDLLRDECNACSRSFTSNPSIETATQFTAAYKLYCKALIEGLNCSLSFFDAALKEGAVAQICYWFNQEELDNIRSTICDLQKTVQDTYNYLDSGAYNSYIFTLEYLEEAGLLEDPAIQEMDIAPLPEVELDLEQAMNDIRSDVFTVSSTHYTEDTVLASDLETYGEITVSGGTLDLGGHTMHVMNNFYLTGGSVQLSGGTLCIDGDPYLDSNIDLLNGTLIVTGNVLHSNGTLYLNKGSLTVSGDYRQQSVGTNSAQEKVYSTSYGKIVMQYDEDLLQVGGDWILQPSSVAENVLESGRIELSGGLQEIVRSSQSLSASDTHTIALVGAGPHSMHLDSSSSKIAHLEVEEGAVITWDGYMNAAYMESDCTITSNSAVLTGLNLNGHTLQITGDIEINTYGTTVDCLNGSLVIDGNVLHSDGSLYLNKGSLTVSGDYRQQSVGTNSAQEKVYSTSYGKIVMQYEADSLTIGRDMYVQPSSSCGTLTAGTLRIGGNFEQLSGTFAPNGTHTTILNGTGARQIITFSNSYSRFHILDLSRDGTYYEFTPDSCWNSLKEPPFISEVAVTGIRINARTKTMTLGEQFQLTAAVMPENATDPTLCWSSDQESVASVDDTGLVTAVGEGKTVIRVEASNGLYRTCAITVHEVFSGTFEVGSCNALPGETLILTVRVYDNPGFAALQLSVEYDESLLTPVNVTAGSLLATGELRYQTDQNTCRILWYDTQDMTQNGILFYVHFQVNAAADLDTKTSIILHSDYGDICQADHTNISFFMENGTIFIKDVLVGDIYEDEEINVHDILLLQQYLTGLEGLSGRQQVAADLDGDSIVSIKDIVRLAQILLGIPSDSGIPTLQSADPLSIQVINSTVDSSGNVEIPVLFLNCSGIAGLRLQVDYDPALLTLTGIKSSSELKENLCTNLSDPDREATWITWYNATNLHLDGQMLTLCFQLADPNYSGIIPVSVHCNTGDACTEALTTISVDDQYGLVRTDGYSSDVQVQNLMLNVGEKSSILHGSLCCNYDLQGTQVDIIAAVYRGNQLYAAWTGTGILGKEVEIAMDQEIDNGMTVRLFVLQKENYQPLCPVTQLNK